MLKPFKKIAIALLGATLVIIGIALLVLPGPGFIVIIAGLVVLSTEFEWANRYLHKARTHLDATKTRLGAQKVLPHKMHKAVIGVVLCVSIFAGGVYYFRNT